VREKAQVTQTKYSDAGAEVTKNQKKYLGVMILKVEPYIRRNRDDEQPSYFDIGYSIKDKQKSYFEALPKKKLPL
jgi:hypothetical protein